MTLNAIIIGKELKMMSSVGNPKKSLNSWRQFSGRQWWEGFVDEVSAEPAVNEWRTDEISDNDHDELASAQ